MAQDAGVKSIPELRQFGSNLNQASVAFNTLYQQLNSQMHRACDTWYDDKARAFMSEFEGYRGQIEKMSSEMQKFSTFVMKSCDILEQYNSISL